MTGAIAKSKFGKGSSLKQVILFLAANPNGSTRLELDRECAAIQRELKMARHRDDFRFESRWAVGIDELMRYLRELDPTVIHFSGHGAGSAGLMLEDEQGKLQVLSGRALTKIVGATAKRARLVVLNACYSAAQAEVLCTGVDCVVGMDGAIGDIAARRFAVQFYGALGDRRSVGNAVENGIAALAAYDLPDEQLPRCLTRDGVDEHQAFLRDTLARPTAPTDLSPVSETDVSQLRMDWLQELASLGRFLNSIASVDGVHVVREHPGWSTPFWKKHRRELHRSFGHRAWWDSAVQLYGDWKTARGNWPTVRQLTSIVQGTSEGFRGAARAVFSVGRLRDVQHAVHILQKHLEKESGSQVSSQAQAEPSQRQPFKPTHFATGTDDITGVLFRATVMVVGDNAFTEAEWNHGRASAPITWDPSRTQWCHLGGYKPVSLTPLS